MNGKPVWKAVNTSMAMEASEKKVCKWTEIERADVEKAIADIKCGKVEGINGVTLEMVTY